jgi:hypothetical protein
MKRHSIYSVVLAAAAVSVALPAAAQVDQQCIQQWQQAISTRALDERCKSLDAATAAKLKALEDSSLACATAKASAADKAQLEAALPQIRQSTIKEMATAPCDEGTKSALTGQATKQLTK